MKIELETDPEYLEKHRALITALDPGKMGRESVQTRQFIAFPTGSGKYLMIPKNERTIAVLVEFGHANYETEEG